jgi:DNA polymerase-1
MINQLLKTILKFESGLVKFCVNDRIYPMFFPFLETRRCSSSSPNTQNLPNLEKEKIYQKILGPAYPGPIRNIFVADPDYVFVEVDYKGAELLALALVANDDRLIEDYYNSLLPEDDINYIDIHSYIAITAFGLNCVPTKQALKEIGKEHLRFCAKRIIFGLNYGRGTDSICRQLNSEGISVTVEDVEKIIETIYQRYPKIPVFQESVRTRIKTNPWICNMFGGYRRFIISEDPNIQSENEREAINFYCQSTVADAVAQALYNAVIMREQLNLRYRLVLQNHDAIVFLVHKEDVEDFCNRGIQEIMVKGVPLYKCDLNGKRISDAVFYFGVEYSVNKRLGKKEEVQYASTESQYVAT